LSQVKNHKNPKKDSVINIENMILAIDKDIHKELKIIHMIIIKIININKIVIEILTRDKYKETNIIMTEIILKIRINHIRIEHTIIIIVIIKYSEGQRPNCNFFNLKVRNMKNIPKGLKSIKIKSIRK